jgi:transglutaminase-like putative cysteine protease
MRRRQFLQSTGMVTAGVAIGRAPGWAQAPASAGWRSFEIVTRVEVLAPAGLTRVWVPTALSVDTPYQRKLGETFDAGGGTATLVPASGPDALGMVSAEFPEGTRPELVVTSRVATRDHVVDLAAPPARAAARTDRGALAPYLRPTRLLPTDGIVRATADKITAGRRTELDKARAIYDWIVENTFRDPKVRGCGVGDIRGMLQTGNLGGKCADLNALYVGLARAAGLPARDVYGIRTAPSRLGYKSLGASSATITKSQHCRAEVHAAGYGWIPVDPADVRKVALEEPPGNRPLDDDMVRRARQRLFGSWEMNWMAYNFGHDVPLPGSKMEPVGFLMYPQVETAGVRRDCLDPDSVKYEITSRALADAAAG